ncbi:MAG: exodeoxyribonuclease-3 [Akkermansiaceae bacterium]
MLAVITLIIATSTDSSADVVADSHPKTLRVISYNTWYLFHKKKEMKAGQNWLKRQTLDIVALQELTRINPEALQSLAESWSHKHSSLLKSSGFSVGLTSRYPI